MANANRHAFTALNAGEWAPALDGRGDIEGYRASAQRLENFIPTIQGPIVRRGGTRYLGNAQSQYSRLIPFVRSRRLGYVIEVHSNHMKFWFANGQRVLDLTTGDLLNISAPWGTNLEMPDGEFALDFAQDGDQMYITHRSGEYAPRVLRRRGANSFSLFTFSPSAGPFDATNSDSNIALYVTGVTGSIDIIATNPVFSAATDVGRLIRIDVEDDDTRVWSADSASVSSALYVRSDGKEYSNAGGDADNSGFVAPTHKSGVVSDSRRLWRYRNAMYGIARITRVVNSERVEATVLSRFPQALLSPSQTSSLWCLGAWYTGNYPTNVTFFRERLVFGQGRNVQMSWAGIPTEFALDDAGDITPECAVSITLRSGRVDEITCLADGDTLFAATEGGEFTVGPQTDSEPFGPGNIRAVLVGSYGAAPVRAPRVGASVLSVQAAGRRLRAVSYDVNENSQVLRNAMVRAEHLTGETRIVGLGRQDEPYPIVWARTADGQLYSLTYDPLQSANGWARHPIGGGGIIKSFAVIPSTDGREDELWLMVQRGTAYHIERMLPGHRPGQTAADAVYFDAAVTYDGDPVTSLSGLGHLAGATVGVLADGAAMPPMAVTADGVLTLPRAAGKITVGHPAPAVYVGPMKVLAAGGTDLGRPKRDVEVTVSLENTLGGRAGPGIDELDDIPDTNWRAPATPMDSAAPLFTGLAVVPWRGGYEIGGRVCIVADGGYPMTIRGVLD